MRKTVGNVFWGLAFIGLGVIVAGNSFDIWRINLFFDGWWTLFIIVPCFISMIQYGFNVGNIIGLSIGVLLLLGRRGVLDMYVLRKLIVPLIFVAVGVSLLFSGRFRRGFVTSGTTNSNGTKSYVAIFGGQKVRPLPDEPFLGGDVTAIFGSIDLDLTDATIDRDIALEVTTIFGGVEIKLPKNVKLDYSSVPIFGGASNKFQSDILEGAPVVKMQCTCVFGGTDIK